MLRLISPSLANDWTMPEEYLFKPLNRQRSEIRLLHLNRKPADGETIPRSTGRLEHVPLSAAPKYNALSYVWGNPTAASAVFLDDGSYLPIAANLFDALSHLPTGNSPVKSTDGR